ncbi:MAG: Ig-like domain-containing protein [Candidatus Cloacimonetes bacterium]|nr:Ig-like domain-containing protein [Candidatus Cloacimonadota bacterium]
MNKVFRLAAIVLLTVIMVSCGSRRNPTGGPEDTVKPEVLTIMPQVYTELSDRIEITFSKPMDRSSFTEGLYFYPPIMNKKISYSGRALTIQINEKLLPDTNYHLTLSTRIKDLRGNALAHNQSYTFASGKLNNNRLSGQIAYENPGDMGKPIILDLLDADSLLVCSGSVLGSSYAIDALNPASYILRAYQDLDGNGRYDFGREAYFEEKLTLQGNLSLDLMMAYADSTVVRIQSARAVSNQEVEVSFNKPPSSLGSIKIQSTEGKRLPILLQELENSKLTLITAPQDSSSYRLVIADLLDSKKNYNPESAMSFANSTIIDENPPLLLSSKPRNGTSVSSLRPVLELEFNKIIPMEGLKVRLVASDTKQDVPLQIIKADSRFCQLRPTQDLTNYRSYQLIIEAHTQDTFGNRIGTEESINFLPLIKSRD